MNKCKKCGQKLDNNATECPVCGKKVKKTSMGVFFIKMVFLFIFIFEIIICSGLLLGAQNAIATAKYGNEFVVEGIMALLVLAVMLMFGNSYVFKEKRRGFFESVKLGWPMLIIALFNLIASIIAIKGKTFDSNALINLVVFSFAIGCAEEFLCRGWLLNEFTERYKNDKKQIIASILLSSLIFGIMHISNIWNTNQGLFMTIMQILEATACGFLLGSIYYKTKNIWSVVFIHAFWDFAIFLRELPMIRDCETGVLSVEVMTVETLSTIAIILMYILTSILVLRSKTGEKVLGTNKEIRNQNKTIVAVIIGIIIFSLIPFNVEGSDQKEVCFNYETKKISEGFTYSSVYQPNPYYELTSNIRTVNDTIGANITEEDEIPTIEKTYTVKIYTEKESNYGYYEKIVLENEDGEKVYLDYEPTNFYVFENDTYYVILINEVYNESTVYYSRIYKETIDGSKDYLESIKNSFIKFDLPVVKFIGDIKLMSDRDKVAYMNAGSQGEFIIDKDGKLYLLKEE